MIKIPKTEQFLNIYEKGSGMNILPGVEIVLEHFSKKMAKITQESFCYIFADYGKKGSAKYYLPISRIQDLGKKVFNHVFKDIAYYQRTVNHYKKYAPLLVAKAKNLSLKNFENFSNAKLKEIIQDFYQDFAEVFPFGEFIAFTIEPVLNQRISQLVKAKIDQTATQEMNEGLKYLTTPSATPFMVQAELDLINLTLWLKKHKLSQIFRGNLSQINRKIDKVIKVKARISQYLKNWQWAPYDYGSIIWTKSYVISEIRNYFQNKANLIKIKKEKVNFYRHLAIKQRYYERLLKLTAAEKKIFQLSRLGTAQFDYRKMIFTQVHFYLRPLLYEIARRLYLKKELVHFLLLKELLRGLGGQKLNKTNIKARWEKGFFLVGVRGKVSVVEYFDKRKFLKMVKIKERSSQGLSSTPSTSVGVLDLLKLQGVAASSGTIVGRACLVLNTRQINKIKDKEVLVTYHTTPDYVPAMKKASAIVTDHGGITCHAAIISRELGIPCVVGTGQATQLIKDGDTVEVRGNHGYVNILNR
jgi:phosphoenolpyruvate synthase/pyruvate phosphate dikinase